MGSVLEFNDTLKLRRGDGFPNKIKLGGKYSFSIADRRIYHLKPVRVFLVEEIEGLWNFIGQVQIIELTINAETNKTSGRFIVTKLYERDYAQLLNKYDSPPGKGYIKE